MSVASNTGTATPLNGGGRGISAVRCAIPVDEHCAAISQLARANALQHPQMPLLAGVNPEPARLASSTGHA